MAVRGFGEITKHTETRRVQDTDRSVSGLAEEFARQLLDIAVASVALLLLSPLLALIAIIVKLDSPGPVLFRQVRIGRNHRRQRRAVSPERRREEHFGKPFTLYKFRTMYADARARFPELYEYSYSKDELKTFPIKVLVAQKGDPATFQDRDAKETGEAILGADPRVTRVGRWLRRTSLDELPNLFNVLKGDMHLVGPRPDITSNIAYYSNTELEILAVKPGITGLAQVRGRGLLTFEETNNLDLKYIRRRTLWLDIRILIDTIPALWKREGAY